MKKTLSILLLSLVVMCAALTGCSSSGSAVQASTSPSETPETAAPTQTEATDPVWERIQTTGKIVLGSSGTYSPYTYFDDNNEITGFDVELAKKVAEKLGFEVEYVQTKWDALIAGVQSDRLDLVANQVAITDERKESVDFSDPYCAIYPALAVKTDSTIASFEDLKGKTVCLNLTTVFAPIAEGYGATTVSSEGQMTNEVSMVQAGRCDATIDDEITLQTYINSHSDAGLKVVDIDTSNPTYVGFMMKQGSTVFEQKVNEALAELVEEGVVSELSQQFIGLDISVKE